MRLGAMLGSFLVPVFVLQAAVARGQIAQDRPMPGSAAPFIEGHVLHENGAPVAGARVVLSPLFSETGQTAFVDNGGRYAFYELRPGRYKLTASVAGQGSVSEVVELVGGSEYVRLVFKGADALPGLSPAASKAYEAGLQELGRGRFEQSLGHLERAIKEAPDYAPAYTNLGVVYLQLRAPDKARRAFQSALDRDESSAGAYLGLGLILNDEKRFPEAETHLLEARKLNPSDWHVLYELGRAYHGLQRLGEAESSLREAERGQPKYGNLYVLLANVLILQDKYAEGLAALERSLQVAPDGKLAPQVRKKIELLKAEPKAP